MKSPVHTITMLLVLAALLCGCEKSMNLFVEDVYDSSQPISFTAEMFFRGTPVNSAAELVSMGVFCAATGLEDWNSTATANKMFNEKLNNSAGTWTYHNSEIYWSATDITERYSFFAYTPYASTDNGITVNGSSSTQGKPTLTYTVPNDVTKQPDLMLAVPRYNIRPTGGKVALGMKHALTCVGFQIMGNGEQLTAISISGVAASGDLVMDGGNIAWTNLGSPTATDFSASINYDTGEDYFTLPAVMTNLIAADGYLMMIPQALGNDAKIKLTFKDNTTKEINLDNFTWEAGKRITYNITVMPEGTITVTPDNVLLPYTAQNPAAQSLSVVCLKNDGSPNPSAQWTLTSSQPWLTLSLNSNGSAAAATITGTGSKTVYLVSGQNAATAPRTSAIFLNGVAGNPVANITQSVNLNNIPGGGTSMLPRSFAGAFWRAGERGERIIRIPYSGDWSATVVWMDGRWNAGDIVLDVTPFTSGELSDRGITWNATTENPKDADLHGFFVNGNTQSVSGSGNIFFRIGLKQKFSDLPSCELNNPNYTSTFPARYAVILITHRLGVQKLFLRQGEGADYLMRPEDGINSGGYTNTVRPSAVRFSPYNLTAVGLTGTTQSVQINSTRSNAAFTDFPTQAGAFFQWASTLNTRYAYSPVNPTGAVSGWDTGAPSTYWDALRATHESCPPGYRRPTDGAINVAVAHHMLGMPGNNNVINSEMRQSLFLNAPTGSGILNNDNTVSGYYADGWFDRREIVTPIGTTPAAASAVSVGNNNIAYTGILLFNPATNSSLFFPVSGLRSNEDGNKGNIIHAGTQTGYWSSTSLNAGNAYTLTLSGGNTYAITWTKPTAHLIRCVRE